MRDTELYEALLGLKNPWRVTKVKLDSAAGRVDVWAEDSPGTKWDCPEFPILVSDVLNIGADRILALTHHVRCREIIGLMCLASI